MNGGYDAMNAMPSATKIVSRIVGSAVVTFVKYVGGTMDMTTISRTYATHGCLGAMEETVVLVPLLSLAQNRRIRVSRLLPILPPTCSVANTKGTRCQFEGTPVLHTTTMFSVAGDEDTLGVYDGWSIVPSGSQSVSGRLCSENYFTNDDMQRYGCHVLIEHHGMIC